MDNPIFTDEEQAQLISNLDAEGDTPTADEIGVLLEWAVDARTGTVLLKLVLAGKVRTRYKDGELRFFRPEEGEVFAWEDIQDLLND